MAWCKNLLVLFDIKKQDSDPNTFQRSEKNFYFDQLDISCRKMYLSEEIDEEFEAKEEAARSKQNEEMAAFTEEVSFIFEDDVDECTTDLNTSNAADLNRSQCCNVSLNRSGLCRINTVDVHDASTQTDAYYDQPQIRLVQNCTEDVKSICVEVSVKCCISAQNSITSVQMVCKGMYGYQYYRTNALSTMILRHVAR